MKVYIAYFKLFNQCGDLYRDKVVGVFQHLSSAKRAAADTVEASDELSFIDGHDTWYCGWDCGDGYEYHIEISEQEIQV